MKIPKTLYRRCPCGETAFDLKVSTHSVKYGKEITVFVWECRNCRNTALDRQGDTRVAVVIREVVS